MSPSWWMWNYCTERNWCCVFLFGLWSVSHRCCIYLSVTVCRKVSFPLGPVFLHLTDVACFDFHWEWDYPCLSKAKAWARDKRDQKLMEVSSETESRAWVRAFVAQMIFSWAFLTSWVRGFAPAWSLQSGVGGSLRKAQNVFWRTSVTCVWGYWSWARINMRCYLKRC